MGVVMLEDLDKLKLKPMISKHSKDIFRLVGDTAVDIPKPNKLRQYIRKGYGYVLEYDKEVVGVLLASNFDTHISLDFFYIAAEFRRKPSTMIMLASAIAKIGDKPMYVRSKDISTFKNMAVKVPGMQDVYRLEYTLGGGMESILDKYATRKKNKEE